MKKRTWWIIGIIAIVAVLTIWLWPRPVKNYLNGNVWKITNYTTSGNKKITTWYFHDNKMTRVRSIKGKKFTVYTGSDSTFDVKYKNDKTFEWGTGDIVTYTVAHKNKNKITGTTFDHAIPRDQASGNFTMTRNQNDPKLSK